MHKGKLTDCKMDNNLRDIDILPVVKNALLDQYTLTGSHQTVFVNQYGNPYTRSDKIALSKWRPLISKCGLEYRVLYKTRHMFASVMLQRGEEIGWVSKMLGHANINITLTKYTEFMPRKEINRAEFLNEIFN